MEEITSGGFHSHVNLEAALNMRNNNEITVKAVIPKGTPYFEGNEIPYKLRLKYTWTNDMMSKKLILKDPVIIENNIEVSADDIIIGGYVYMESEIIRNIWEGKDNNSFNIRKLWKKAVT